MSNDQNIFVFISPQKFRWLFASGMVHLFFNVTNETLQVLE
jgi:hypothetical protein